MGAAGQLSEKLQARGPAREVDIDNMAQRVSLEVRAVHASCGALPVPCACIMEQHRKGTKQELRCQRMRAQVIGQVGFGKAFGSLEDIDQENEAFKLVASGARSCPDSPFAPPKLQDTVAMVASHVTRLWRLWLTLGPLSA